MNDIKLDRSLFAADAGLHDLRTKMKLNRLGKSQLEEVSIETIGFESRNHGAQDVASMPRTTKFAMKCSCVLRVSEAAKHNAARNFAARNPVVKPSRTGIADGKSRQSDVSNRQALRAVLSSLMPSRRTVS